MNFVSFVLFSSDPRYPYNPSLASLRHRLRSVLVSRYRRWIRGFCFYSTLKYFCLCFALTWVCKGCWFCSLFLENPTLPLGTWLNYTVGHLRIRSGDTSCGVTFVTRQRHKRFQIFVKTYGFSRTLKIYLRT